MRLFFAVSLAVLTFTGEAFAQAGKCPADAGRASFSLWPAGTLGGRGARGAGSGMMTGTHPCGRKMECSAGQMGASGSRKCRWL